MVNKREFIKGLVALAAAGTFLAGYREVINRIMKPTYTEVKPDPIYEDNVRIVYSSCLGCNVRCGIRARVVNKDGIEVVERIEGNPYHVYNRSTQLSQIKRFSALAYDTPVSESLNHVGTLCARGVDGIHYLYDPYRVIKPLKRAGPRGSGKWKVISWEQLIREVVEGGTVEETGEKILGLKDIFTYGVLKEAGFEDPNEILSGIKSDVDAILSEAKDLSYEELLNKIEEFKSKWNSILAEKGLSLEDILIDPDRPDLGPKANQLIFLRGRGQGHADYFYKRWTYAIGSVNWRRHTSSCQLGFYTGNYLSIGYTDINPDSIGAKVLIMAGAQMGRIHPGATGQGIAIERAADGELKLYYVNPIAPRTQARGNIVWVPIKPGEDAALALAIARWIFENEKYNKEFLETPNEESANAKGEPVATNATWLVIAEPGHPREGEFVKDTDLGLGDSGKPVVVTHEGTFASIDSVDSAQLFYQGTIELDGESVTVKTALQLLKEEAYSRTMEQWSRICGVPVETIIQMAKDFTSVGRKAATYIHRGVAMHPNGEYIVWAYRALDFLIGNYHRKGGLMGRASHTKYNYYLYNTDYKKFGEPKHWGPPIDRCKAKYESTLEYWLKVKKGEDPYPTKRPWYPHSPEESYTEIFAGIKEEYPYPIRALFLFYANPVLSANYGTKFIEVLKDTKKLPLFVALTTTINETYLYADYIVPDTTYLETGTMGMQYLYASSGSVKLAEAWRTPVVMPFTEMIGKDPAGRPRYASMWEFLIDIGKMLDAPGFGDEGIPGASGNKYEGMKFPLHSAWDYIMRVYSNGAIYALDKGFIPENVPESEVRFVEENYPIAQFKDIISEDEWRYVAYCLARGGIFTSYEESYDENEIVLRKVPSKRKKYKKTFFFWNEDLAKSKNSVTGNKFYGGPKYLPPATYGPVSGITPSYVDRWLHGVPLRDIYPESEYPFKIVIPGSPLYTKHRSLFYYWMKQIMPENFVLINPDDAKPMGIETGDIIKVETPFGAIKVKAVVEPSVAKGTLAIPVGMGRWADTLVAKPEYIEEVKTQNLAENIPETVEIPEDALNPVRELDPITKKLLFTKSPPEFYESGSAYDEWRFNGVSINPVLSRDPSLDDWPLLSWLGAAQAYFTAYGKVSKVGVKEKLSDPFATY
jgi:anaerobic selenocysteine-containing dehydrogenase